MAPPNETFYDTNTNITSEHKKTRVLIGRYIYSYCRKEAVMFRCFTVNVSSISLLSVNRHWRIMIRALTQQKLLSLTSALSIEKRMVTQTMNSVFWIAWILTAALMGKSLGRLRLSNQICWPPWPINGLKCISSGFVL